MLKSESAVDLSIIIVNYNSKDYLIECFESIISNTKNIDYEIIVVDNASTDNSVDQITDEDKRLVLIRNEKNVGFSAANNQGLKISRGRYILLLNHDTYVKPLAINKLIAFMDNHKEAGACGAKLLNPSGTIQQQCKRGFPTPSSVFFYLTGLSKIFPKSRLFGHYLMTYMDINQVNEVDALSGACMLVRKKIMDGIGGLDTNFFLYGEDLDLCYRIKAKGWKIYYVPQAEIIHYGGVGSRTMSYKAIYEFYRSMYLFYKKHYKSRYQFFVTWLVYAGIIFKGLFAILLNLFRREKIVGSKKV